MIIELEYSSKLTSLNFKQFCSTDLVHPVWR